MTAPTRLPMSWRKSSYSGDANCVEVACGTAVVGVRDSKRPVAGELMFSTAAFQSFVNHIKGN
jgi:hypothetical protein